MKLISLDPSGTIFSTIGPIIGLVSLGVTVQSKRNQSRLENAISQRNMSKNLREIRNEIRSAGENFEDVTNIIKSIAVKYDNKFLESKFRSGVHLIMNAEEAKEYIYAKTQMDNALCSAMVWINGSISLVLNSNPKSATCFIELVGLLEGQINDLFSMQKTYKEVIDETHELLEILNQRLSEFSGNKF